MGTSRSFLTGWVLCVLVSTAGALLQVKVKPGQDVSLQCVGATNASITLLEWSRPDLKSDGYVFFFRDRHLHYQHPSFVGRVELRDPELKDGDASVVLRNVSMSDSGTYECWIITSERDYPEPSSIIHLRVEDSAGHTWDGLLLPGLSVGVCLTVAIFVFLIFIQYLKNKSRRGRCADQTPSEETWVGQPEPV